MHEPEIDRLRWEMATTKQAVRWLYTALQLTYPIVARFLPANTQSQIADALEHCHDSLTRGNE